jgi:hypothetical protein
MLVSIQYSKTGYEVGEIKKTIREGRGKCQEALTCMG